MYDEANLRGGAERSRRGRVAGLAARTALDVNLVAIAALVALVRGAREDKATSSPLVSFAMTESINSFFQLITSAGLYCTLRSY